jgi:hypothetical protein
MKSLSLLVSASLLAAALPSLAQTGAGTPPLNPNAIPQISQTLKLPGTAQPGTLTTSKAEYKPGQAVRITFKVINTSGKRITYNFGSGQRYDIAATNAAGIQVWRWSQGKLFTQNLASVSIAPGKTLVYHAVWNEHDSHRRGSVPPGVYTLSAHLTSNNRPAITGGVIVNTNPDPDNMGFATRTPAESGTIRQVAPAAQVSAKTTIMIK